MRADSEAFARLHAAIEELAGIEAADALAEARIQARTRVREMLSEALANAMLEQVHGMLEHTDASASVHSAPPEPRGELAWYVHGVVPTGAVSMSDMPAGLDGREPVTAVHEGPLSAIASRVALADFDETCLREHLADMEWVEATARAHERVLDVVRTCAPVIPMRMCTVYRTEAGLREMLRREAGALQDALVQLSGRTEWGVKVIHDRRGAAEGRSEPDCESPGAAYLQGRRHQRDSEERVAQQVEQACGEIHERLSDVVAAGVLAPPQRPEVSGHEGQMVMNGAYLVDDDALGHFRDEVRSLQDSFDPLGLKLVITGPWPAYNFVPGTIGVAW